MVKHILIIIGGVVLYSLLALVQLLILSVLNITSDMFTLLALALSFAVTILVALLADSWK